MHSNCQPGKASPIPSIDEKRLHSETKSISDISNNVPEIYSSRPIIDEVPLFERLPRSFRHTAADHSRRLRNPQAKFSIYEADPYEDAYGDEAVFDDAYEDDLYEDDPCGYDNTHYEINPDRPSTSNTYNPLDYSGHGYQPTPIPVPVRFPLRIPVPVLVPRAVFQRRVRGTLYPFFFKNVEDEIKLMQNERKWVAQRDERSKASFDEWVMGNIEAETKDLNTRLQELEKVKAALRKLQGEVQEGEDAKETNVDEGVAEVQKEDEAIIEEIEVKETKAEVKVPETALPV